MRQTVSDAISHRVFGCASATVVRVFERVCQITSSHMRRATDYLSILVLTGALLTMGVVFARAQVQNQDTFNGSVAARLTANDGRIDEQSKRIDKVESVMNWAAGGLVANLVAHILQISTNVKRRREDPDEDRPRISER